MSNSMERSQILALFAEAPALRSILSTLELASLPPRVAVHFAVLNTRRDIDAVLFNLRGVSLAYHGRSADHVSFMLERFGPTDESELPIPLFVQRSKTKGIVLLMSCCTGTEWRERVGHLVRRLYPFAYQPFLGQNALLQVVERLQAALPRNQKLRVVKVSQTRPLLQRLSRRRTESGLRWTDVPFADAFNEAAQQTIHFRKISLQACIETDREITATGLDISVGADGTVSTTSRAAWVHSYGVELVLELAGKTAQFAEAHAREERAKPSVPLVAAFSSEYPIRKEDIKKVAAELRKLPDASVSVTQGNPYLRASISDQLDGSSYEVVLTSETRLLIIPQLRATQGSITRLCRFIYDAIGEAEFTEQDLGTA